MSSAKNRVVIVGAGMGGLTAAAYLARNHYDVLLLEKNDRAGGLVSTFTSEGFAFDTGPRAFVNSGMVKPIMQDLGIEWEWVNNKISIVVQDQQFTVESMASIETYREILNKLYPKQTNDIATITSMIKKLSEYNKVLYEFDNPYFSDYMKDKVFVVTKLLPWTFKLLLTLSKFKKYSMPMEDYLAKVTDHQPLIDIITQFFFRKTPTYFALGYFNVWLDYFYPKGGTIMLPKLVQEKAISDGAKIKYNTLVKQIIPSQSKVIDQHGVEYEYDHLVWASDLKTLYRNVDLNGLDAMTIEKVVAKQHEVFAAKPAESSFIVYAAFDLPSSYFKTKGGEHFFFTPSSDGLGETCKSVQNRLLEDFNHLSKVEVLAWLDDFCRLNTYEVSIPVLRDVNLAPENQTGIMISCLLDFDVVDKVNTAGWGDEFKREMEDRILKQFTQALLKDVNHDILFKFSSTPLTINKLVGSSGGSIVGWSFETKAPVFSQLGDMPKCALTPIPKIYQAGQWAYAPAGVPIAMLTGWHASQEIIKSKK
jgi:phytoene dehydrogenase-like protein